MNLRNLRKCLLFRHWETRKDPADTHWFPKPCCCEETITINISKWGICPHGIFASCTWYFRGLTRRGEFLGLQDGEAPPSPSSGTSSRHSGRGTLFGVCPYGIGPCWKLWTLGDRFAQNFDTFHMGRVVWPGEPFMKKDPSVKNMHFFKNVHVQKIQKCHFPEQKSRRRPNVERSW